MREILFRGKRLDNGEWVYGAFVPDATEPTHGDLVTWGFIRRYNHETEKMETIEVDRDTVGQYTGLTDKNGKKIFEGDILEGYTRKTLSRVLNVVKVGLFIPDFHRRFPELNGMYEDAKTKVIGIYAENIQNKEEYVIPEKAVAVVIGNIHDNPELLESPYKEGST